MKMNRAMLLVEDNEDDVLLMKLAIKQAEIKNPLFVVEDGDQAIAYLSGIGRYANRAEHPMPAVVFLDLKLPFKSGHEVLAWIRQQKHLAEVVVIILTSSNEPVDIQQAYRLGVNSYIVKPPTAIQLTELAKAFRWYWLEFNEFAELGCSSR